MLTSSSLPSRGEFGAVVARFAQNPGKAQVRATLPRSHQYSHMQSVPMSIILNTVSPTRVASVVLLFALVVPTSSSAQVFGLRGGMERTQIVTDVDRNTIGTETGLSVGAFVNLRLPANLGLSVEGLYSQKIVTQQNLQLAQEGALNPDASLHLGYIQIPITMA